MAEADSAGHASQNLRHSEGEKSLGPIHPSKSERGLEVEEQVKLSGSCPWPRRAEGPGTELARGLHLRVEEGTVRSGKTRETRGPRKGR